jgi:hypothetical protein
MSSIKVFEYRAGQYRIVRHILAGDFPILTVPYTRWLAMPAEFCPN